MKFFDWKAIAITYVESAAMIGVILLIVFAIGQLRMNLDFGLLHVLAFIMFSFAFRFINLIFHDKDEKRKKYAGTGRDMVAFVAAVLSWIIVRDSEGSRVFALVIGIIVWLTIYIIFGKINKRIFGEDI